MEKLQGLENIDKVDEFSELINSSSFSFFTSLYIDIYRHYNIFFYLIFQRNSDIIHYKLNISDFKSQGN